MSQRDPSVTSSSADRQAVDVDELAERVGRAALELGLTVGVAESLTGGMVVQALARASEAGTWLRGGIVAYARAVKQELLHVDVGPVVSEQAARQMASGARRALGADVVVAVTGVGGPDEQDGQPPGSVWIALDDGSDVSAAHASFGGDPSAVCLQAQSQALQALVDRFSDPIRPVERIGG